MHKFQAIAFTGIAGAGKTTAAQAICDRPLSGFCRVSFAQPIRAMLAGLGLGIHHFTDGKTTPIEWLGGKTPRELMQTLGTEWGRQLVDPEVWVTLTRRLIRERAEAGWRGVVLDDCRFDNEARMVREMGGRIVKIYRPDLSAMTHASERGISAELIDAVISSDPGDIDGLRARAVDILGVQP